MFLTQFWHILTIFTCFLVFLGLFLNAFYVFSNMFGAFFGIFTYFYGFFFINFDIFKLFLRSFLYNFDTFWFICGIFVRFGTGGIVETHFLNYFTRFVVIWWHFASFWHSQACASSEHRNLCFARASKIQFYTHAFSWFWSFLGPEPLGSFWRLPGLNFLRHISTNFYLFWHLLAIFTCFLALCWYILNILTYF